MTVTPCTVPQDASLNRNALGSHAVTRQFVDGVYAECMVPAAVLPQALRT